MLERAVHQHGLSARAHDRILKLALTRADLEGHARIDDEDLQLAIDCRIIDRRGWLHANTHGTSRPDAFSRLLRSGGPLTPARGVLRPLPRPSGRSRACGAAGAGRRLRFAVPEPVRGSAAGTGGASAGALRP